MELDARTSDAIALALRFRRPIYITEDANPPLFFSGKPGRAV
ncbi:MAG: bifunctional nuclease family protein [Tannerella sp.]|nr:bifunctional nuclease family protein [Tannerella sp.]